MSELQSELSVVALVAGLNGLIYLLLFLNVGRVRMALKINMGDDGNPRMIRAMRGQANFVENVPMGLVFLLVLSLIGMPVWALGVLGAMLVIGRLLHALHFCADDAPGWQRAGGIILNFGMLILSILSLFAIAVHNLVLT